jgi:hypothetical protein
VTGTHAPPEHCSSVQPFVSLSQEVPSDMSMQSSRHTFPTQIGVPKTGQLPHPSAPPQPSSIIPHSAPTSAQLRGTQSVVVVGRKTVVDVVVTPGSVVVDAVVVGVTSGRPQLGTSGSTVALQVRVAARRRSPHTERHSRPALPSGHACWQVRCWEAKSFLHFFGQRPASAGEASSKATRTKAALGTA